MMALKTIFEKINGKYNLQKILPTLYQYQNLKNSYNEKFPTFFPPILGLILFIVSYAMSHSIAWAMISSLVLSVISIPLFNKILKFKLKEKIYVLFPNYRTLKLEYNNTIYYFQNNLSSLEFQKEIFDFLEHLHNKISLIEEIFDYHKKTDQQEIKNLILNLEKCFSTHNYQEAINKIKSSTQFLYKLNSQLEKQESINEYRLKIKNLSPKLSLEKNNQQYDFTSLL